MPKIKNIAFLLILFGINFFILIHLSPTDKKILVNTSQIKITTGDKNHSHSGLNHSDFIKPNTALSNKPDDNTLPEWEQLNGYDVFLNYFLFDENESINDEYAYYDLDTLKALALGGDIKGQIWYAMKIFSEQPEESFYWLQEVIFVTGFSSAMLKLSELSLKHLDKINTLEDAYQQLEQTPDNMPTSHDKYEQYKEAVAWAVLAANKPDPIAKQVVTQLELERLTKHVQQEINVHTLQLTNQLEHERSLRGIRISQTIDLSKTQSEQLIQAHANFWQYIPIIKLEQNSLAHQGLRPQHRFHQP